jgi:DNA-binding transcriptional ArsR family regulator
VERGDLDNSNTEDGLYKDQNNQKLPKDLVLIYSTEDERIREIGKLLASDTSRKILKMLFSETLTTKQIAQRMGLDIPLAKHHINRMLDLGIIKVEKITKSIKDREVKCYTASHLAVVILSPPVADKAKSSKLFMRSFRMIHKMTSIGIAAVSTWFGTQFLQHYDSKPGLGEEHDNLPNPITDHSVDLSDQSDKIPGDVNTSLDFWDASWFDVQSDLILSAIAVLTVMVIGVLFFIWHDKKRKNLNIA